MTAGRLLLRNLAYHWRGNVAVGLGVVVGTAVLTGALLVGDSLRGSLKELTLRRLGWVDHALVGGRFVREKLADELDAEKSCPAILLQGAATTEGSDHRAGRVTILGVDERFWQIGDAPLDHDFWHPADADDLAKTGVVLNTTLANELGVAVGDRISLHLQKASDIPRESILGRRGAGDVLETLPLTVKAVLPDSAPGARFSLNPSPEAARNAFVPLGVLQSRLDQKGRANALLVQSWNHESVLKNRFNPSELPDKFLDQIRPSTKSLRQVPLHHERGLQASLNHNLDLDDWGLIVRTPEDRALALIHMLDPRSRDESLGKARWQGRIPDELAAQADKQGRLSREKVIDYYRTHHGYLSLESRQMVLDDESARAALKACRKGLYAAQPIFVYIADTISDGTHQVPYSVVAAVGPMYESTGVNLPLRRSSGLVLGKSEFSLKDDEIILAEWPGSPLTAKTGEKIRLVYYQLDQHGRLEKKSESLILRAGVPLRGDIDDPDWTPEFRGVTDKLDIRNWENPPFPYDPHRITAADEQYWNRYRTAPKAFVTLQTGQRLWGSRFGQVSSFRFWAGGLRSEVAEARGLAKDVLTELDPVKAGFVFESVRDRGLLAASGGTDFDGLFLGFSFFLIIAALLLVGLLFRLNMDRRATEIGILFATGYRRLRVGLLLLAEGAIVSGAGSALGCIAALIYASLLLNLLQSWWPGGLDRSFLTLHVSFQSVAIGFVASLLVSVLTIAAAVWLFARVPPRVLLTGDTSSEGDPAKAVKPPRRSVYIAGGFTVLAIVLVVAGGFVRDHEARAGAFFSSGASLLTAALAALWAWMKRTRHGTVTGRGLPALTRLGARNGARNPLRSILTAGLLAAAAFLIVAVESFRRRTDADYLRKDSGSGGFSLLAESDVPLFNDLNSEKGREGIVESLQRRLQQEGRETGPELAKARGELAAVEFFPFRTHGGDDASCLNLYQPRRPKLLGASSRLIERGGFQFAASEAKTEEERQNSWRLLDSEGDVIPVIGEANTVTWMLKSKLGGELEVQNERGETVKLRIVGLLQDSVFQSGLIMSEKNLLKLYPSQEGYNLFLIDTRDQQPADVRRLLETALADRGFEVTPTAERLEQYLAVENTYLSTFQLLGGLGLLLGALGLAVVLLRGVWERRGELALLRALGYRSRALGWLVLAENGFLLLLGLAAGTVAALLSVAPYLIAGSGQLPLLRLLGLLLGVLLVGLIAGALAVRSVLQAPLIPALRRE